MSCKKANCGCSDSSLPILPSCPAIVCATPEPCGTFYNSDCVIYTGPDVMCNGAVAATTGERLTTIIQYLVDMTCPGDAIFCNGTEVVAEGSTLSEALSSLITYFCGQTALINDELAEIELHLTTIDEQIITINSTLTIIEGEITDIQTDISNIQTDITNLTTALGEAIPPGVVMAYAGLGTLAGWLFCNGDTVTIAYAPALYAALGTTYNIGGEPVGSFRLPNLIDKVIVGYDQSTAVIATAMGLSTAVATQDKVTSTPIDVSNLPEHTHTTSHSLLMPNHTHNYHTSDSGGGSATHADSGGAGDDHTVGTDGSGTASISGSITIDNGGGAVIPTDALGTVNVIQPFLSLQYIIKL